MSNNYDALISLLLSPFTRLIRESTRLNTRIKDPLNIFKRRNPFLEPDLGHWVVLVVLISLFLPLSASAELVILSDGSSMKVESHQLLGEDRLEVVFPKGGTMIFGMSRVERIVEDEVIPEEERVRETGFLLNLGFDPSIILDGPYSALIMASARQHGINPNLIAAMMRVESAHNPRALSHKGARGLMQLMPATAERFGVSASELYQPARNIEAGVRYLKWLKGHFEEDALKVIAAYNAGEGAVARYGGIPPYRETQNYVRKVMDRLGVDLDSLEPVFRE